MVEGRSFAMLKWNQRHQCAVLGFYTTHVCELVGCPDQIAENCSTTVMSKLIPKLWFPNAFLHSEEPGLLRHG